SPRLSTPGLCTPVPIHRLTRGFGLCSPGHPPVRTTHRLGVLSDRGPPPRFGTSERHKLCRAGPGRRRMVGGVGLVWLVLLVGLVCLVGLVWLVLLVLLVGLVWRVWPCGVWVFGVSQI